MNESRRSPRPVVVIVQVAAVLAGAMGIGRFVYTPILPMMTEQTALTASGAALLATMNYLGYLIGAAAGIVFPRMLRSRPVNRLSLVVLVASLALMPVSESMVVWSTLRLIAGVMSAVVFMSAAAALMSHLGPIRAHLAGWGMSGVGIGIAASGALVLGLRASSTWEVAWLAAAALGGVLTVVAWNLLPEDAPVQHHAGTPESRKVRTHPWFAALLASYTLEGVGYIIAGTFLVAAINQHAPAWVASGSWILVGIASAISTVMWAALQRRFSRLNLLAAALGAQGVGVALPALSTSTTAALVSAVLYGGTFVGIVTISFGIAGELRYPRAVAILTTGYSVGQILGPLVVAPLLRDGYRTAMLVGAGIVVASLLAALLLRIRYPHPGLAATAPSG